MWFFRFLFTETARLLRSAEGRSLLGLAVRYGDRPRNQMTDITFGRYKFRVPDALSFVWQYREIFVDEFYKFSTTNPNPVIFDCGTNIGTSIAWFQQTYPAPVLWPLKPTSTLARPCRKTCDETTFRVWKWSRKRSGRTTRASGLAAIRLTLRLFSPKPTGS